MTGSWLPGRSDLLVRSQATHGQCSRTARWGCIGGELAGLALPARSGGGDDGDAVGGGSVGESFVVGDNGLQVVAEDEGGGDMDSVEGS